MLSVGFRLFAALLLVQAVHAQAVHAQEGTREAAPAAETDGGGITLGGLNSGERDGFIRFDAQADYRLPAALIAAMNRDTQLVFVTQIQVLGERRLGFLPARKIARLQLRRRIGYHSLTRKYIVDDLTFARQAAFNALDDALDHLGRYRDISVIQKSLAAGSGATHVRIRVKLSRTDLPLPMQAQSLLPDWWLYSDWYQWPL